MESRRAATAGAAPHQSTVSLHFRHVVVTIVVTLNIDDAVREGEGKHDDGGHQTGQQLVQPLVRELGGPECFLCGLWFRPLLGVWFPECSILQVSLVVWRLPGLSMTRSLCTVDRVGACLCCSTCQCRVTPPPCHPASTQRDCPGVLCSRTDLSPSLCAAGPVSVPV